MKFKDWYSKNSSKYDCESGMEWVAKLAWDYQQKRIDEFEKTITELRKMLIDENTRKLHKALKKDEE